MNFQVYRQSLKLTSFATGLHGVNIHQTCDRELPPLAVGPTGFVCKPGTSAPRSNQSLTAVNSRDLFREVAEEFSNGFSEADGTLTSPHKNSD